MDTLFLQYIITRANSGRPPPCQAARRGELPGPLAIQMSSPSWVVFWVSSQNGGGEPVGANLCVRPGWL